MGARVVIIAAAVALQYTQTIAAEVCSTAPKTTASLSNSLVQVKHSKRKAALDSSTRDSEGTGHAGGAEAEIEAAEEQEHQAATASVSGGEEVRRATASVAASATARVGGKVEAASTVVAVGARAATGTASVASEVRARAGAAEAVVASLRQEAKTKTGPVAPAATGGVADATIGPIRAKAVADATAEVGAASAEARASAEAIAASDAAAGEQAKVGTAFTAAATGASAAWVVAGTNFTTSEQWCTEKDSAEFGDCWDAKPPRDTPMCTVDSGTSTCRCKEMACHIDMLQTATPMTGRCKEKWIYVRRGRERLSSDGEELDVTGKREEVYCKYMVKNDQWAQHQLVKTLSDPPASNNKSWWQCWAPDTWHNDKCHRSSRYLGESCWKGSWAGSGGICRGSHLWYHEYSTACYRGRCVPFAWAQDRVPCECSWIGWNFVMACTSSNGTCGGHACVWDAQDGGKYCDWATSQTW